MKVLTPIVALALVIAMTGQLTSAAPVAEDEGSADIAAYARAELESTPLDPIAERSLDDLILESRNLDEGDDLNVERSLGGNDAADHEDVVYVERDVEEEPEARGWGTLRTQHGFGGRPSRINLRRDVEDEPEARGWGGVGGGYAFRRKSRGRRI